MARRKLTPFRDLSKSQQNRIRRTAAQHGVSVTTVRRSTALSQEARGHTLPAGTRSEFAERMRREHAAIERAGGRGLTTPERKLIRQRVAAAAAAAQARAASDLDYFRPRQSPREAGDAWVKNFEAASYEAFDAVFGRFEGMSAAEFYRGGEIGLLPTVRNETRREERRRYSQAWLEALGDEYGMTLDPDLETFAGGPSPSLTGAAA